MGTDVEEVSEVEDVQPEPATTDVDVAPGSEDITPVDRPVERPVSDRRSRKQARLDVESATKARDELQRTLETERQERQRLEREFSEFKGTLAQREQAATQNSKETQTLSKVSELRQSAKSHLGLSAMYNAKGMTAEANAEWKKYEDLNDEANDLRDELRDEKRWERRRGELQQHIPNPAVAEEASYLAAKYPQVAASDEAKALAGWKFNALAASGRQRSRETMEEAITWAAKRLNLGGHTAPSDAQRARYGGVSAGEGAGGGNEKKTIRMGRHEEALARAAYRHMEPKEAYKQWAKDRAAEQAEGRDD